MVVEAEVAVQAMAAAKEVGTVVVSWVLAVAAVLVESVVNAVIARVKA